MRYCWQLITTREGRITLCGGCGHWQDSHDPVDWPHNHAHIGMDFKDMKLGMYVECVGGTWDELEGWGYSYDHISLYTPANV